MVSRALSVDQEVIAAKFLSVGIPTGRECGCAACLRHGSCWVSAARPRWPPVSILQPQLHPANVQKVVKSEGNDVLIHFCATDPKMLRGAVGTFTDLLGALRAAGAAATCAAAEPGIRTP